MNFTLIFSFVIGYLVVHLTESAVSGSIDIDDWIICFVACYQHPMPNIEFPVCVLRDFLNQKRIVDILLDNLVPKLFQVRILMAATKCISIFKTIFEQENTCSSRTCNWLHNPHICSFNLIFIFDQHQVIVP